MAKSKRSRKRNPKGALYLNPKGGSKRTKRTKRAVSLASLLSRVSNPRKRRHARRNPLTIGNPRKRHGKRRHARRNPLQINPRKRHGKRRHARRNPLQINPRKRHGKRRHARRNPATTSSGGGFAMSVQSKAQGLVKHVPVVGGFLASILGGFAGAVSGALGVLPTEWVMPYVGRYLPDVVKPYGYTLAGMTLAAIVKLIPVKFPMKNEIIVGLSAAGGAVDMFRFRHGQSHSLGSFDFGEEDMGDVGDEADFGNEGTPLAAIEYADADLGDANYCGDNFSAEELSAIELGREVFRRKFYPAAKAAKRAAARAGENPTSAGMPGVRWGWLIYWIGFDAFQNLAARPEAERRHLIEQLKAEAHIRAHKLLSMNEPTTMQAAETAGLLVHA